MAEGVGIGERAPARAAIEAVDVTARWQAPTDTHGFAALMHQHQGMVFSLAYHFLQNRAAAEDVTQDVFLRLYQNLQAIQSPAHLRRWLQQVTGRRCIDLERKARIRRFLSLQDAPEPAIEIQPDDPVMKRRLQRLVATLPPKLRMIVLLRYQEDLEPPEIADVLGMPLNTVRSSLRRSLELLRNKLDRLRGIYQ